MFIVIIAHRRRRPRLRRRLHPAIFGITHNAYLVFAANAFALMGLRQLYFRSGGLAENWST